MSGTERPRAGTVTTSSETDSRTPVRRRACGVTRRRPARAHAGNAEKRTDCLTCHVFAPNIAAPKCESCHSAPQGTFAAIAGPCHDRVHAVSPDARRTVRRVEGVHDVSQGAGPPARGARRTRRAASTVTSLTRRRAAAPTDVRDLSRAAGRADGLRATIPASGATSPTDSSPGERSPASGATARSRRSWPLRSRRTRPARAAIRLTRPRWQPESCTGCHASIRPVHDGKTACVGCHEPHTGDVNAKVDTCTTCHKNVAFADTAAHAGGIACVGCHKPHDFAPPADRRAFCATCHAPEATLASANKGHVDCVSCHGPSAHQPSIIPVCGNCHAPEQTSAPPGHQKCLACHDPHAGTRPPLDVCRSCHLNRDRRSARRHTGRLRELSPAPRPRGPFITAGLPDVPRTREAPRAPRDVRPRDVHRVPHVTRTPARRPRDVHRGRLPRGQARAPAAGAGVRRVPRLSALVVSSYEPRRGARQ